MTRPPNSHQPSVDQLPLRRGGRLHQGRGGRRDRLARVQDQLVKVQVLVRLLWTHGAVSGQVTSGQFRRRSSLRSILLVLVMSTSVPPVSNNMSDIWLIENTTKNIKHISPPVAVLPELFMAIRRTAPPNSVEGDKQVHGSFI